MPPCHTWNKRRVVLPFSYGKDSLLSLATLQALGYEVFLVNIDERVLPRGNSLRLKLQQKLRQELGLQTHQIINEIQLLSDYQILERPETCLHQVHIHFVYLLAMLPFCRYFQAPTIVLNNEYHNSLNFMQREGYLVQHTVMQSHETTDKLAYLAEELSAHQITAINLLGGLGDFAIHRLLHEKFPHLAPYRVSCHLEMCDHERWCHDCPRCIRAYLFFLAQGQDPAKHGFSPSMLKKECIGYLSMAREQVAAEDNFHLFQQQEERLALEEALATGVEEPIIAGLNGKHRPLTPVEKSAVKRAVFSFRKKPNHPVEHEAAQLFKRLLSNFM